MMLNSPVLWASRINGKMIGFTLTCWPRQDCARVSLIQGKSAAHYPVNVGYEHVFHPISANGNVIKLRCDIVNLFDEKYELRDGSGIGVGAAQFGPRLGFFAGLSYDF